MNSKQACYLCHETKFRRRKGRVRDNPSLRILECTFCGLVFLSSFEHITARFYEASGMHGGELAVDMWKRETACDDDRRFRFLNRLMENKSVLDFGCGNGGFLLRAKRVAARVAGVEVECRLKNYFQAEGLDVFSSVDEVKESFDIIALFHVLEHIPDPIYVLRKLRKKLKGNGSLIIEVPSANDALLTLYQSVPFSHFTYWSPHLFLFNNSTLAQTVKKAGYTVNYIKQIQRYPLSNHLYWLSKGKPGGHQVWHFLDSEELRMAYERALASIGCCDTIIGSFFPF